MYPIDNYYTVLLEKHNNASYKTKEQTYAEILKNESNISRSQSDETN